ncbi:MAG: NAD-dependent epimerase/dehydratase family protein, partial [Candidatus Sumerlaeota bacterium]|nr:NAD-dependent epimerase/dehydratase family protein [Candidatus Sumerlaeota bacterium]
MKILVTGAAGFIGSHLAERLCDLGHEAVGLDCFTPYYARPLKEANAADVRARGAQLLEVDLAEDDLDAACDGAEVIYHFAAQPGISDKTPYESYARNNMTATWRLLEAARKAGGVRCFVNISTSSVYGFHATDSEETAPKPTSFYGVTKLAAEQLALAYHRDKGLPACSLRLFSVYGERERPEKLYPKLIRSILENAPFPLYEGSEKHSRSFTYVG